MECGHAKGVFLCVLGSRHDTMSKKKKQWKFSERKHFFLALHKNQNFYDKIK